MPQACDLLIRNGKIYDGSGAPAFVGDVAIVGDQLLAVGAADVEPREKIDAGGLAVAPGFINMLSWAGEALIHDGRSQSDIRQGVTLEVMGEGRSMGPYTEAQRREHRERQGDIQYEISWSTVGEYLEFLENRGVSCNVASFIGATTVREHVVGFDNRAPSAAELERMCDLVRAGMQEGALGVSSALAYTPAAYASTEELTALARAAAEYSGLYISHIRNEADALLEAYDEFERIVRDAHVHGEVYHIKAAGAANWHKFESLLRQIEAARDEGLHITADMYPYHASSSGLDACMPPWVQEGGHRAWINRLKEPDVRARVIAEMKQPSLEWDNFYTGAGSPENIVLVGFKSERLKSLAGRTLADVAAERDRAPEEVVIDLTIEDDSNVGAAFFSMDEANVAAAAQRPWVSFCSDAQSVAAEGLFLQRSPHPRTYGSFARVLGPFTRDMQLLSLEEAVRRMSSLPAENLRLSHRGRLAPGHYADVVIFDPAAIRDTATFANPHSYAVGVQHVLVNGVAVIRDGEHTGAKPGRFVRGPGAA